MTIGSLFSGIGGLEMGLEMCGLGPVVWQAENDPAALAVLAQHWPTTKRYTDVRDIDERAAHVDVVCGGFPCQDVSAAGKGEGLTGERSGLWWQFRRVVRQLRPRFVFVENVASGTRRWLPVVRRSLWRIGYASVPLRVSASNVGAPHRRARVFVLAYPHGSRELQPGGALGAQRGWAGNGGGPWAVEPDVGRVADGVPARAHRLRLLGNAVVPQQAALAWRLLTARAA